MSKDDDSGADDDEEDVILVLAALVANMTFSIDPCSKWRPAKSGPNDSAMPLISATNFGRTSIPIELTFVLLVWRNLDWR